MACATMLAAMAGISGMAGMTGIAGKTGIAGTSDVRRAAAQSQDPPPEVPVASSTGPKAVPAARRAERVAILTIEGPVDDITRHSLERRLERARADGVDAVVLELDTPGGEMLATLDICRLIKHDMPANTVAWIRPTAFSAGTLIALSAREIIVVPEAVFGDSAPISAAPGLGLIHLPAAERAKIEGPLLSEVVDSARRNHWDEQLVQAFVAVGVELWLLENVRSGERVFVDRAEYRTLFGDDPPEQLTSTTAPKSLERRQVRPYLSDLFQPPPRREKERDLSPEAQRAQIEFEQTLPTARPRLNATERDQWRLVTQIDTADRLLTVRSSEALAFGLATEVVPDDEALGRFFAATTIRRYDESWSEGLARFCMSWPVRFVLIAVMIICFLVELAVPGFGVFGLTAVICLVALIGAPALVGLAQWWQLALVLLGVALVAAEVLIFPGTLFVGLAGAVSVLVGVAGAFVQSELNTAAGQRELLFAIGGTIGATVIAAIVGGAILRRFGGAKIFGRAVLSAEIAGAGGGRIEETAPDGPGGADAGSGGAVGSWPTRRRPPAAGVVGTAHTDLRPAGKGVFDGALYDVRSTEGYLEKGRSIRVVRSGPAELEVESDGA